MFDIDVDLSSHLDELELDETDDDDEPVLRWKDGRLVDTRRESYPTKNGCRARTMIGVIPVDAIFSPVRRVAFSVEPTRVEQSTNFDRLILDVETDGSITPRVALSSAGQTLRSLVALVADLSENAHVTQPTTKERTGGWHR